MSREGSVPMGLVMKSPHDMCSTKLWLKQPTPPGHVLVLPPEIRRALLSPYFFFTGTVARGGG